MIAQGPMIALVALLLYLGVVVLLSVVRHTRAARARRRVLAAQDRDRGAEQSCTARERTTHETS